jgi:hypothetical protein
VLFPLIVGGHEHEFLCINIISRGKPKGANGRFGYSVKYDRDSTEIVAMRNHGFDDGGYQHRRELRRAYQKWIAQKDLDLFVTLSLARNIGVNHGRQKIRHLLACIDSHYLGAQWARRACAERTEAYIFPESIEAQLHYHCLMRLPERGQLEHFDDRAAALERLWKRVENRGTCEVGWIYDLPGAARYVTKQLVRPGYLDQIILASDFHPESCLASTVAATRNLRAYSNLGGEAVVEHQDRCVEKDWYDERGFTVLILDLSLS